jgi:hypothetical protein
MACISARTIPDYVDGYGKVQRFSGVSRESREVVFASVRSISEQTLTHAGCATARRCPFITTCVTAIIC